VRLGVDEGNSIAALGDLDLTPSVLDGWVAHSGADRIKGRTGLTTAEREELAPLRKESGATRRARHLQQRGLGDAVGTPLRCDREAEGQRALYDFANVLDRTLHLSTSGRKTKLVSASDFVSQAKTMMVRGDLDEEESRILEVVQEVTDSPYAFASFDDIPDDKQDALSQEMVTDVLEGYLRDPSGPDYPKLRWFLRRLAQVAAPGAVEFVISNLQRLTAAMPDVANYQYRGFRDADGNAHVMVQDGSGREQPLPHFVSHSPSGFEWGTLVAVLLISLVRFWRTTSVVTLGRRHASTRSSSSQLSPLFRGSDGR
jgi:hypothetical protein